MQALVAFFASLFVPLLRPKLVLFRYLLFLFFAMTIVTPIALILERNFGSSQIGIELAEKYVERAWIDLQDTESTVLEDFQKSSSTILLLCLVFSFTVISGGTLWVLVSRDRRSSLPEILAGAGRLSFAFLRLLPFFVVGLVVLYFVNRSLTGFVNWVAADSMRRQASSPTLGWILHGKTMLMLLLMGWLAVITGYAKCRCVIHGDRFMTRTFFSGLMTALRNPLSTSILAGIGPLLFGVVVTGYALARDALPAHAVEVSNAFTLPRSVGYLLLSQTFALLAQAALVIWAASILRFYRTVHPPMTSPEPPAFEPARHLTVVDAVALVVPFALLFAGGGHANTDDLLPQGPWNNSYTIQVTLQPQSHSLIGQEQIVFKNLETKPVDQLQFHLYANAFSNSESVFMQERRRKRATDFVAQMDAEELEERLGYCHVKTLTLNGQSMSAAVNGSVMSVPLPQPLQSGESVTIDVEFETRLPRTIARMGWWEDHYDVMQWYPKLGVCRDGQWYCEPFHADTEFFADFGDYDVTIIVPEEFIVGASGELTEAEVTPPAGFKALRYQAQAVHDFAWCADKHFQEFTSEFLYEADATSPEHSVAIRYLCQPYAVEKAEDVLEATEESLRLYGEWFMRYPYPVLTIDGLPFGLGGGMEYPMLFTISQSFPNHLSFLRNSEPPVGVTVHEFGHQYWYGIVASDECTEAWLDEGINTYVTTKIEEEYWDQVPGRPVQTMEWAQVLRPFLNQGIGLDFSPWWERSFGLHDLLGFHKSPFSRDRRGLTNQVGLLGFSVPVRRTPGLHLDRFSGRKSRYFEVATKSPIRQVSYAMHPDAYGATVYSKTALCLATLERTFGWDAMRESLREYVNRFKFKHPTGDDFFTVLREVIPEASTRERKVTDRELDRYIRELFETTHTIDFAITKASSSKVLDSPRGWVTALEVGTAPIMEQPQELDSLSSYRAEVLVENLGQASLPVDVLLVFENGNQVRKFWDGRGRFLWVEEISDSPLKYAIVDPRKRYLLDLNFNNNSKTVRCNKEPVRLYKNLALYWTQNALTALSMMMGP